MVTTLAKIRAAFANSPEPISETMQSAAHVVIGFALLIFIMGAFA
ncbi:hypothetical protein GCM10008023_05630 [Sphingomonas glacialis]|uniref:Uncharacterized protein n=1 Tax=Sphingomonas glacialis TaxID=658225 RepID=A0ABQ3LIF6_9SPHN|nr:hypothetical protein [Sphingomonas glacialis]GHH09234.1 hypothetical protein GCM10008023_05630 [Sphingomonas glacialis]